MPQTETIDNLVNPKAFDEVDKLVQKVNDADAAFIAAIGNAQLFTDTLAGSKGAAAFNANNQKAAASIDRVVAASDRARLAEIRLQQAREKAFDDFNKKLAQQEASQKRASATESKALYDSTDQRKQLTLALKDQEVRYANLYLTQGKNAAATLEAKKGVLETRAVLDDLNNGIGRYGDNVRNYSSAFTGYANTLRGLRGPTKLLGEALGLGAQEADQFRLILEHSFQGIAAFFRGKEAKAAASAEAAVATTAETAAETVQTAAQNTNTVSTEANTVATEGAAVAETELAVATTGASVAMNVFRIALLATGIGILIGAIAYGVVKYKEYKEAVEKAEAAQRLIGETNLKGAQNAQSEIESLNELYRATQNHSISIGERKKAVDELQKQYPDYFKNIKDETILAGDAKGAYKKLAEAIVATAKARASEELIAENSKRQLGNENTITESKTKQLKLQKDLNEANKYANEAGQVNSTGANSLGNVVSVGKALAITRDINTELKKQNDAKTDSAILSERNLKLEKNIQDIVKKNGVKVLFPKPDQEDKTKPKKDNTARKILDEQLKQQKLNEEAVLQSQTSSFAERLAAVNTYEKNSTAIIQAAEDKKTIGQTDASNRIKAVDLDAANDRIKIDKQRADAFLKTQKENYDAALAGEKALEQVYQNELNGRLQEIEANKTLLIKAATDQYAKGEIDSAVYNQKIYDIEADSAKERVEIQIKALKLIAGAQAVNLAFGIGNVKEIQDTANKIADLQIKASDLATKKIIDNAKLREAATKQLHEKEIQLGEEILTFGQTVVDGQYQQAQDKITAETNAIDKKAAADKAEVERSLLSDADKKAKEVVIDAQAQAQKDELAKRSKKLAHDQAQADRAFTLASIAGHTALAVVSAFAPPPVGLGPVAGIPLAIAIGAIGLTQIATVLARPLPAYFTGTPSSKAGPAWVGEKGVELAIEPGGKKWLTPEVPTLMNLKGGTKIINNKELMQSMARPPQFQNMAPGIDIKELILEQRANNRELRAVKEAILAGQRQPPRRGINYNDSRFNTYYQGLKH